MASGQEANGDKSGMYFRLFIKNDMLNVLIEPTR